MNQIEQIRQEIERQIEAQSQIGNETAHHCARQFSNLLSFIDSLPEENKGNSPKVDDAMAELEKKIALVKESGTWVGVDVDKYMDKVRGGDSEVPKIAGLEEVADKHAYSVYPSEGIANTEINLAFKAGAEWMAGQGETMEGEVVKDINGKLAVTAKGFSGKDAKFGDKVIVQIRKKK